MSRFDERARDWDTPERRRRALALAGLIREQVALSPTMRVIEVGAGTGLLGLELAGEVGEMVLTDPSAGMMEVTREKIAASGLANVTARPYDVEADPPPDQRFDLAVSLLMLHHVADTPAVLRSIHALLAVDGRIALADLDAEDGSFHSDDAESVHHDGFARTEIMSLAESAGFVDVATRTAFAIEREGRDYPLFLLTGRKPHASAARSGAAEPSTTTP